MGGKTGLYLSLIHIYKMKKLDEFREKVKNDKNTVDFFTDLNSLKYVASPTFRLSLIHIYCGIISMFNKSEK